MKEFNLNDAVLIAGASGLVGRALCSALKASGKKVVRLVRREAQSADEISWDPSAGRLDLSSAPPLSAAVNLSGESVFGLWTAEKRKKILASRLDTTRTIVSAIGNLAVPPQVFVCSSAIGIYGPQTAGPCSEDGPLGRGFLAEVCKDWEAEAKKAEKFSIRTVSIRTGLVLSPKGGMLGMIRPAFKLGLGGRIGTGSQIMSWIDLEDLVGIYLLTLDDERIKGPLNAAAPQAASNQEFTAQAASVLHRPAIFPVPAALLRLLPGGFAEQTVLSSIEAAPTKALEMGYVFRCPDLRQALVRNLTG